MRARHRDEALATILDGLAIALAGTCLAGRSGAGSLWAWGGWSSPAAPSDGRWLELKLHHHPDAHRLDAGLIAYLPMRDGGGTRLLDECSWRYDEARARSSARWSPVSANG
jgi:hypothetical protein